MIDLLESNDSIRTEKERLLDQLKTSEIDSFQASDKLLKIFKEKYGGI